MLQLIDKKNKIFIYLILLFILSTISNKALQFNNNSPTLISKIIVTGLSKNNNLKVEKKMNYFFNENIFFLRKEKVKSIMSEYNIIEEYSVKKIYPSKINIKIKPTKLVARVFSSNKLIVGSNGKLIQGEETSEILPYVSGKFDTKKFLELKRNIENSKFNFSDFKILSFFPSSRWDILTTDEVLIKLPENNLLKSLNLGYKIINNDQFKNSKLIDLRIANQVIVQ
jgi:cell division protein FtsQ